jgi:succinoglycan biosynthesis transport protein ExoP
VTARIYAANQAWLPPGESAAAGDLRREVSIRSVFGVLRRRKLAFLIPALLLTAGAIAFALLLPDLYRAEAVVGLVPGPDAEMQELHVPPEVDIERQMKRVTEIVHRRALLERVGGELGLFANAEGKATEAELRGMRALVRVNVEGPKTLSLTYEDGDPERARDVTARLAELLLATSQAERQGRSQQTVGFIQQQIAALEKELEQRERDIERYRSGAAGALPEQVPALVEQLRGSETMLQETAGLVAELESRRTAVQRQLKELDTQGLAKDPARAKVDKLSLELAQLRRRYTERHPEVARVQAELEEAESAIAERRAEPLAGGEVSPARLRHLQLEGELQEIDARLARSVATSRSLHSRTGGLQSRLAEAPKHELALSTMLRAYETEKKEYQSLLEKLHEAQLTQRLETATHGAFTIVETPRVPTAPFAPHRARIALLGLLGGIGLGFAAAFVREQLDTSYQSVEDLELPTSQSVLAAIPALEAAQRPEQRGLRRLPAPEVTLLDDPFGAAAEQYRILATKLLARCGTPARGALLITSSSAHEGKTTAAVNVSLALSKMLVGEGVLLVDADLGRPSVHRVFDIAPSPGLSDLLANPDADPGQFVRCLHGLYVLPAGEFSPLTRGSLSSPLGQRVLTRLRKRFSYVVFDAPPILAVAEGLILQQVVDSVLLVVRARVTPRELVRRSLASLDPQRLAGIVMTDVDGEHESYNYSYFNIGSEPLAGSGNAKRW